MVDTTAGGLLQVLKSDAAMLVQFPSSTLYHTPHGDGTTYPRRQILVIVGLIC